jgi:hypothetical protein
MLGSINIVAFVPTKDAEKAKAFYVGVLGLRFVKDDGFALVLDANGIMIRVAKAEFTPLRSRFWDGRSPTSRRWWRDCRRKACTSRGLDFSNRMRLGYGPRRAETKWRGSRIPMGIFYRSRNMGDGLPLILSSSR